MDKKCIDIIILATIKNIATLQQMIPYVRRNVGYGKIMVIADRKMENIIKEIRDVEFIDENTVLDGMNFATVAQTVQRLAGTPQRAGWYFQQFLKLAWAYRCRETCYIAIDADTIPLNKIEFWDENGRYLFTKKTEYNKPYFNTIARIFDGELSRRGDFSFVAEHMVFDCMIVREMLNQIMRLHPERGESFYEIILNSIEITEIGTAGFSEFETYGTYIMTKYPEMVKLRKLRALREATYTLGSNPNRSQLKWAEKDFDIISIEVPDYQDTVLTKFTKIKLVQKSIRLRTVARARKKIRKVYRKVTGKANFEIDEL